MNDTSEVEVEVTEWPTTRIRASVLSILASAGRQLSFVEIHNKMTTCPKQPLKTQINYMSTKDVLLLSSDKSRATRYRANGNSSNNRVISMLWRAGRVITGTERRDHLMNVTESML
jgi:hypothetical protein